MSKKPNQHVMTAAFRTGLTQVYVEALAEAGIYPEEVRPHIIGAATVTLTDDQLEDLRGLRSDMTELSGHGNSGRIKIVLPEGIEYLKENRPTLTEAERQEKYGAKGTGRAGVSAEERARRAAMEAELKALLESEHGIDLDSDSE